MVVVFVTFEGVDGSGKSTQVRLLGEWLRGRGLDVVVTREPGGTELGRALFGVMGGLEGGIPLDDVGRIEALLFSAARLDHVARVVRPYLRQGSVVVCDRFVDSTWAYQSPGGVLERLDLATVVAVGCGGLWPDLTVVLDVNPVLGLERRGGAGDRFERRGVEVLRRARETFLECAAAWPDRYLVVDGLLPVCEVAGLVQARVGELLELGVCGGEA